jgi:hypothetical protein
MLPERRVQPRLSFSETFQLLIFVLAFFGIWQALGYLPNREEHGPVTTALTFKPVDLDHARWEGLSFVGAWELKSPDSRFGGFSGLAIDKGGLLALSDNGALAYLPLPGSMQRPVVTMRDLPDGPGSAIYIWYRDAESLARDPLGRGWWVAFEVRHEIWLFDPGFTRALKRVRMGAERWPLNRGAEGLVALPGPELLVFPEDSTKLYRTRGTRALAEPVQGRKAAVSDAAVLPGGRLALIERSFGATGFRNDLAIVERRDRGHQVSERFNLPAGILTNFEGVAAEARPDGAIRLWIISDDNFERPLRTLLLAVDLPPKRRSS